MRRLALILVCVAGVILVSSCRKGGSEGGEDAKKVRIAVIPKGTTHIFWQSVHAGAQKAADEFGVEIEWIGPERESDREKQIQIVDDCIVKKVNGVVLAPNDAKALVPSVEKVTDKGIPCVIIDSGVDTDKYVTFAATDNYQGGVIAARRMGEILGGKGKVLVLKYARLGIDRGAGERILRHDRQGLSQHNHRRQQARHGYGGDVASGGRGPADQAHGNRRLLCVQ